MSIGFKYFIYFMCYHKTKNAPRSTLQAFCKIKVRKNQWFNQPILRHLPHFLIITLHNLIFIALESLKSQLNKIVNFSFF